MGSKNNSRKIANDGFSASTRSGKNDKKAAKKTTISVVCMILVLALFAGVIIFNKVAEGGYFYRSTVSVSSENYEVNNAMLSYYFNSQYQQMSSSLEQMGVDLTKNLKDQTYTSDMTWFDFIMESYTIPQVEQILVLCEAAKAAGFELDDHEREHVEEAITSIEEMANTYSKQYGGSAEYYIRNMYGFGVSIDDIRDAIEMNQLAAAYSSHLTDSYEYTEEEWSKYLEEHKADFQVVDYVSYTIEAEKPEKEEETSSKAESTKAESSAEETGVASSASDSDETTSGKKEEEKEEELTPEKREAYNKAQAIAQQMMIEPDKALETFNTEVKKYLEEVVYADETDAEKKAEKVKADLEATAVEAAANDESNDFIKFAFSEDREKDVFVVDDNTNGKYTVYLITKAPYIEEYLTRNIRVIALSAASGEKIADERDAIIKEFEEGDKSENAFAELAKAHSDDSTAHENGGLYENQGKSDLEVAELSEWLYSADRKAGDYTSVSNGEKDTSEIIYIAYYVGEGLTKWQRDVDVTMISEAYEADYKKLEETHKVETSLEDAYKIPSQAGLA